MKKSSCSFLIALLLVIANRSYAHPGDGLIVLDDGTFYFVATDPIQGTSPSHHAALWRWSEEGGLALAYRSQHTSSNLQIEKGLDGTIIFDMVVGPERQVFLADWGQQRILRINSQGDVSRVYNDSGHYGPEGLAFHDGRLAVFESSRPRANQGIVPRLLTLGHEGDTSPIYNYSQ